MNDTEGNILYMASCAARSDSLQRLPSYSRSCDSQNQVHCPHEGGKKKLPNGQNDSVGTSNPLFHGELPRQKGPKGPRYPSDGCPIDKSGEAKPPTPRACSIYTQSCGSGSDPGWAVTKKYKYIFEFKSHHQDARLYLHFPVQISVPGTAGTQAAFLNLGRKYLLIPLAPSMIKMIILRQGLTIQTLVLEADEV